MPAQFVVKKIVRSVLTKERTPEVTGLFSDENSAQLRKARKDTQAMQSADRRGFREHFSKLCRPFVNTPADAGYACPVRHGWDCLLLDVRMRILKIKFPWLSRDCSLP